MSPSLMTSPRRYKSAFLRQSVIDGKKSLHSGRSNWRILLDVTLKQIPGQEVGLPPLRRRLHIEEDSR